MACLWLYTPGWFAPSCGEGLQEVLQTIQCTGRYQRYPLCAALTNHREMLHENQVLQETGHKLKINERRKKTLPAF